MKISEDTKKVIDALDYLSGKSLRKKKDIQVIIEICATYDGAEILNNLIFTGKTVWKLQSKLKDITSMDEGAALIQKELIKSVDKIRNYLRQINNFTDSETKERFEEIYIPDNRGTMKNIIDLSFDLSIFKELQNQAKSNL